MASGLRLAAAEPSCGAESSMGPLVSTSMGVVRRWVGERADERGAEDERERASKGGNLGIWIWGPEKEGGGIFEGSLWMTEGGRGERGKNKKCWLSGACKGFLLGLLAPSRLLLTKYNKSSLTGKYACSRVGCPDLAAVR